MKPVRLISGLLVCLMLLASPVFAAQGASYARIGRIETRGGARTSLFVSESDRLYAAIPASWTEPPAIWVYRPAD